MIDAVRFAKARLGQRNKARMMTGDTVSFTSSKSGQTIKGTVTKIAVKYVTVRTALGLYKVPANMLSVVDAETV
jgi:ribosomal protein L35AE/L33A